MPYSVYDLVYLYFTKYRPASLKPTDENKRKVLGRIKQLLDSGWTEQDIIRRWTDRSAAPAGGNLLKSDRFYWHNALRIMPGPTKVYFDLNTGEITREREEWFLEMRASFTLDDLLDYYLAQFQLSRGQINENRYRGTFRYLLSLYDIDLLLFMVDCCAHDRLDRDEGPPTDPIVISDYEWQGREAMNRKITECRQAGGDKIVVRKRVPLD